MTPEQIILVIMTAGLTLYAVFGGADFGTGVWEFNTALGASDRERDLSYRAIGPVWEANHIWLIFVVVALFSAFPIAFAALCRALWVPLLLALVGIVFRGASFVFRTYGEDAVRQRLLWQAVFAFASTATPFFLGACAGAVASGQMAITADGEFQGNYLTGWLGPLPLFTAFFVVGMDAYLAAVYLTREAMNAGESDLLQLWRRRALASGLWMGVLSLAGLVLVITEAPTLWDGFRQRSWPLVALSVATGCFSLLALWRGWPRAAVGGASMTVAGVIWGWLVAQYPLLVPPAISLEAAKAPDAVLILFIWSIAAGAVILVPSLALLFYLFKSSPNRKSQNAKQF
jgi:cytochrome d ubiquinol oxidase subunit II